MSWPIDSTTPILEADIVFLRRQVAPYLERGAKLQRIDSVTRVVSGCADAEGVAADLPRLTNSSDSYDRSMNETKAAKVAAVRKTPTDLPVAGSSHAMAKAARKDLTPFRYRTGAAGLKAWSLVSNRSDLAER